MTRPLLIQIHYYNGLRKEIDGMKDLCSGNESPDNKKKKEEESSKIAITCTIITFCVCVVGILLGIFVLYSLVYGFIQFAIMITHKNDRIENLIGF